jgi:hypothetical protein
VNPFDLSVSDLLIWGIVLHLIADWPLQNDWMANNKASLKHRAAYVHSGIHLIALSFVFGWASIFLAIAHLLIDTRKPVVWWSRFIKQTQPANAFLNLPVYDKDGYQTLHARNVPLYSVGLEVRFWTDQVFHIVCIAIAALLVGG